MAKRAGGVMARWTHPDAAVIDRLARAAGATVTATAGGHMRIACPAGTVVVSSRPRGPRALANTYALIQRETGLRLRPRQRGKR
jgi:hypothetical protein